MARAGPQPRVLVNGLPKAGTHLVVELLAGLPSMRSAGLHLFRQAYVPFGVSPLSSDLDWGRIRTQLIRPKPGQYVTAHFFAHPHLSSLLRELDYRVLFPYRDPRDVAISFAFYAKELQRHPHHAAFTEMLQTDKERIMAAITGLPASDYGPPLASLNERLSVFAGWFNDPLSLSCRFEDLVGSSGGGSDREQLRLVHQIAEHLHRPLSAVQTRACAAAVWSDRSATFRAGTKGEWRVRFDADLTACFERSVDPQTAAQFGYEVGGGA